MLFVGIVASHFGLVLDATTSHFVKEFGLILFIYSIGLQVGPGFFASFRKGEYLLIPPYDEYLIGYKSRDIVLDPEHKHHAHNNSGIFQPVISFDGRICGNWSPFKKEPDACFFIGNHENANLNDAIEKYNLYRVK